jgi:ubiquinone/menaquinone biosynthesis C-methylase UbiE
VAELFDEMPDFYDAWFSTPLGRIIRKYELELVLDFLKPEKTDLILDAGCGTGIFTEDFVKLCAGVAGLDLSLPMLSRAAEKIGGNFKAVKGDMLMLPFKDRAFDKTVSITAIEFIEDAKKALDEIARVTKPGGTIVVATLNSLSTWAEKRKMAAKKEGGIFKDAIFRTPDELVALLDYESAWKTCIFFDDDAACKDAMHIEHSAQSKNLDAGAFVACAWKKP